MNEKGALSVDFLLSLLMILLILTGFISIITERLDLVSENEKLTQSRFLMDKISSNFQKVYSGGNGHQVILKLPEKVGNFSYLVKISNSSVYMEVDGKKGKERLYPFLIVDSTFNKNSKIEMKPGKTYLIKNIELYENYTAILIENWI